MDNCNCPFYQAHAHVPRGKGYAALADKQYPLILISTGPSSNSCGLIVDRHAPCYLSVEGRSVDWRNCDRMTYVRGETVA